MVKDDNMTCKVWNMTCYQFPSRHNCTGIGIGHCGSSSDMLAFIFTPTVIVISLFSLTMIGALVTVLSYYLYKRKTDVAVAPVMADPTTEVSKEQHQSNHDSTVSTKSAAGKATRPPTPLVP